MNSAPADAMTINTELAHALGLHDLTGVSRVVLVLAAGEAPVMRVTKYLWPDRAGVAGSVDRVVQRLRLVPQEAGGNDAAAR